LFWWTVLCKTLDLVLSIPVKFPWNCTSNVLRSSRDKFCGRRRRRDPCMRPLLPRGNTIKHKNIRQILS
jgi:hypothetical protein